MAKRRLSDEQKSERRATIESLQRTLDMYPGEQPDSILRRKARIIQTIDSIREQIQNGVEVREPTPPPPAVEGRNIEEDKKLKKLKKRLKKLEEMERGVAPASSSDKSVNITITVGGPPGTPTVTHEIRTGAPVVTEALGPLPSPQTPELTPAPPPPPPPKPSQTPDIEIPKSPSGHLERHMPMLKKLDDDLSKACVSEGDSFHDVGTVCVYVARAIAPLKELLNSYRANASLLEGQFFMLNKLCEDLKEEPLGGFELTEQLIKYIGTAAEPLKTLIADKKA